MPTVSPMLVTRTVTSLLFGHLRDALNTREKCRGKMHSPEARRGSFKALQHSAAVMMSAEAEADVFKSLILAAQSRRD